MPSMLIPFVISIIVFAVDLGRIWSVLISVVNPPIPASTALPYKTPLALILPEAVIWPVKSIPSGSILTIKLLATFNSRSPTSCVFIEGLSLTP